MKSKLIVVFCTFRGGGCYPFARLCSQDFVCKIIFKIVRLDENLKLKSKSLLLSFWYNSAKVFPPKSKFTESSIPQAESRLSAGLSQQPELNFSPRLWPRFPQIPNLSKESFGNRWKIDFCVLWVVLCLIYLSVGPRLIVLPSPCLSVFMKQRIWQIDAQLTNFLMLNWRTGWHSVDAQLTLK